MNRSELIATVAEQIDLNKTKTEEIMDIILDTIADSIKKGEDVSIKGFGTFKSTHRAARTGRNPRTGETIEIAASTVPTFKASPSLKEKVNI